MWKTKVKGALTEIELSHLKTKANRREEDQTPLVQYNPRSNTPNDRECGPKRCIKYLLITTVILTVVITLAVVLTSIYPVITYSGTLEHATNDTGARACGSPGLTYNDATISKSLFDHGRKGNSSSVCGHKIWAQGYWQDGQTGKGGSLGFTVVGYCTDCGHGDLAVSDGAYSQLGQPQNENDQGIDEDGVSVKWHWLKPIPKLKLTDKDT